MAVSAFVIIRVVPHITKEEVEEFFDQTLQPKFRNYPLLVVVRSLRDAFGTSHPAVLANACKNSFLTARRGSRYGRHETVARRRNHPDLNLSATRANAALPSVCFTTGYDIVIPIIIQVAECGNCVFTITLAANLAHVLVISLGFAAGINMS